MKKVQQKPKDDQVVDVLKRVAKRVEEATVDISDMKSDLKMVNLRLSNVEHNTKMMKVDMEKMRGDMKEVQTDIATMKKGIKEIKRDTEDLIETTGHILKEAVTHGEHDALSQRVTILEQTA